MEATSTNSIYFTFQHTKVRVSDHYSATTDCDLNIIILKKEYVVIPNKVVNKEYKCFTNIHSVIEYIKSFDEIARLFTNPVTKIQQAPQIESNDNEEPHEELDYDGAWETVKEFIHNHEEVETLVLDYFKKIKTGEELTKRAHFIRHMSFLSPVQKVSLMRGMIKNIT